MMNDLSTNHYQSITLWHYPDGSTEDFAKLYVSVESVKLNLHTDVTYKSGKKLMAHLMLVTGKMPNVRRYNEGSYSFTVYDLHGFIN